MSQTLQKASPRHVVVADSKYLYPRDTYSEYGAARDHEPRGILQVAAVHVEVFVVVHAYGHTLCGVAKGEGKAVVVGLHLALIIELVAEDCFTIFVVGRDVAVNLRECADVCHCYESGFDEVV
jgi:hypothetical protein